MNQGDVITLSDNKKYVVVATEMVDEVNYVYIIDQNDYSNCMFCKYYDNKLEKIKYSKTIEKLLNVFYENIKNIKI